MRLHLALRLSDQGLVITLAATNEGATAAPVGLGLHSDLAIGALSGDRAKVRVALPGPYAHILADGVPTCECWTVEHLQAQLPPLSEMLHVPRIALGSNPTATLCGQASEFQVHLTFTEGVREVLLFAPPTENSV